MPDGAVASHPRRARFVAWVSVAIHIAACLGFVVCTEGLELEPSLEQRFAWITAHKGLWIATWVLWAFASMSLIAFAFVWSRELQARGTARAVALSGFLVLALGLPFDLAGECVNIVGPFQSAQTVEGFGKFSRLYTILGVGIANGLYCTGGFILSYFSYELGWLRGPMSYLGFAMWGSGFYLTVAALGNLRIPMVVLGGLLMALFIPWATWVGWRMGRLDRAPSDAV